MTSTQPALQRRGVSGNGGDNVSGNGGDNVSGNGSTIIIVGIMACDICEWRTHDFTTLVYWKLPRLNAA